MFAMNGSEVLGLNRFFVNLVSWAGNLPQKTLRQVLYDSLRRGRSDPWLRLLARVQ